MNKELEKAIIICKEIVETNMFNRHTDANAIETLLNYIDNSISKEDIKEKLEELNENGYWDYLEERDLEKTKNILQEILEGK